jgi:hypothetical protein
MRGHAQHDPAEYVPPEMFEYWKKRDPITRHEKFLLDEKLLDAKGKAEIEKKIDALLEKEREFAENSPLPPPELAAQGVYCEGCHAPKPKWERPIAEVTPPRCSVEAVWQVEGFGRGKDVGVATTPLHFEAAPAVKPGKQGAAAANRPARKPAKAAAAKGKRR